MEKRLEVGKGRSQAMWWGSGMGQDGREGKERGKRRRETGDGIDRAGQ